MRYCKQITALLAALALIITIAPFSFVAAAANPEFSYIGEGLSKEYDGTPVCFDPAKDIGGYSGGYGERFYFNRLNAQGVFVCRLEAELSDGLVYGPREQGKYELVMEARENSAGSGQGEFEVPPIGVDPQPETFFTALRVSFEITPHTVHTPVFVPAKQSTCEQQGNIAHWSCSKCGAYFSDEEAQNALSEEAVFLPLAAHKYKDSIISLQTCDTDGVIRYTCEVCEDSYDDVIPAFGHSWKKWEVTSEATCTAAGQEKRVCKTNKAHIQTREIKPLGHDDTDVVTAPKANALGYTTHTCARCGSVRKDTFTAQTGKIAGFKCTARTVAAVALSWNKVSGVTGYQLQISNAAGTPWADAKATTASTYVFKSLTAGSNYKFRIRTFIKAPDGKNYFAPWVALASPTLPAATSVKVTAAKQAFTAQWTKKAVTGYQIQYGVKSNFAGAKTVTIKNAKTCKYTVKSLKAKTNYYVRIRTYKTIGGKNYFSTWSSAVKVKTK